MLRNLVLAAIFVVVAFVVGALFLPRQVHVERSIDIDRPAITVFTMLNGYRMFNHWSPWVKRDPNATYLLSGPESGVGARMSWEGDPQLVGSGYQQITASDPHGRIEIHLDFDTQGEADSYFDIEQNSGATRLTWGFDTDVTEGQGFVDGLLGRYLGLFFDKWIGTDYEQGLVALKSLAESLPGADFSDLDVSLVEVESVDILYVSGSASKASADVATALAEAFGEIGAYMTRHGLEMAGQPMAITRAWDEQGYHFDAAIPVNVGGLASEGNVRSGQSPGGRAVQAVHIGPYDTMLPTYEKLAAFMAANGLGEGLLSWEHYISDPGETLPRDLVTHVFFLLAD